MALQQIARGLVANDGTGDTPRVAAGKINDNFSELYASVAALSAALAGQTGRMPASYGQYLAALLEPDAIEQLKAGEFSYPVASNVTKYLLASWSTRLGAAGRMEQRNPERPFPLRGVTLNGLQAESAAIVLDPALPSYADPVATYYERKEALLELPTRNITITTPNEYKPFLPGAYGAIITQNTCMDFAWLILYMRGAYGINLADEESDAAIQRTAGSLELPISKVVAGEILSSAAGGPQDLGSVSFVLLPSTWSKVPDLIKAGAVGQAYTWRDDFMNSASLDTGVWTRAQTTAGNVEIDTTYQWCKMRGNAAPVGTWGLNSLYKTAGFARAAGRTLVADIFFPSAASSNQGAAIAWFDGGGNALSNCAHAILFGTGYGLRIFESGSSVGTTIANGWSAGCVYRVKIKLQATGARYYIQGGKEHPPIGGSTWTDITPVGSGGTAATLHPGATAYGAHDQYVSDFRVFSEA